MIEREDTSVILQIGPFGFAYDGAFIVFAITVRRWVWSWRLERMD